MNNQTLKLTQAGIFAALVFAATLISVPAPTVGNVNLGDCMLLLGAFTLGGPWAVVACACGAALCDMANGYALYAPGTLVIKACMVLAALLVLRLLGRGNVALLIAAVAAEAVMVLGYLAYEGCLLGYGWAALANVPFNMVQAVVNLIVGLAVYKSLAKTGMLKKLHL